MLCFISSASSMKETAVREADLMFRADSPHILKVLGVFRGYTPHNPAIQVGLVLDVMEGGSLKSLQVSSTPSLHYV